MFGYKFYKNLICINDETYDIRMSFNIWHNYY